MRILYGPVWVPEGTEIVTVEAAEPPAVRVRLDGLKETTGPEGKTIAARITVPANPFWLLTVTKSVPEEDTAIERLLEEEETLKSRMMRETEAPWGDADPVCPITETV
jgi:hypothetical protein